MCLWPSFTERFDYELELAVIIGREGRNIPASKAREYIAGFTILNDFSARDIQRREMKVRLGPAKGKHWASAVGPWMVTSGRNSRSLRAGNGGASEWRGVVTRKLTRHALEV